jgi:hypothetical protein
MLKKHESVASSFDRLRMRPSIFKGLNLMVSLSNHGQHRFSASSQRESAMGKHRLVPHLIVDGDLDAIDFYERDFGAGADMAAPGVASGASVERRY